MLNYNEITERTYIVLDGEPYEVIESSIKKKNRQKPANQTKLKNLISGSVRQTSFHQSDTVEEADISKKKVKYLFSKPNRQAGTIEYWFCEANDKSKRFEIAEAMITDQIPFMKEDHELDALTWNDQVIGLKLPIKVELQVVEAPPNIKGNTASGADKKVTLETGAVVTVPIFIETGDVVRVNTETGQYVERV